MNKRDTYKQLNIYIPPEWHKLIKIKAIERNITMQEYILQAVQMRVDEEKKVE